MTIKMDKSLTTFAQAAKVKEDMKQFKNCYTGGDLLRAWNEVFSEAEQYEKCVHGDVLSVTVNAFPANWYTGGETTFRVDLIADGYLAMHKLAFYVNLGLEVDARPELMTHKVYKLERDA